ncbi:hypothetical protein [Natrialba aegyptia]|uniref:hypothetical protein n=1 Tax=Natrialba aegyptia TaxID=129789 RepID=UPI00268AC2C2
MSRKDISRSNTDRDEITNDDRTLLDRRGWLKMGSSVFGASMIGLTQGVTRTVASSSSTTQNSGDYYNLVDEVPNRAYNLWKESYDDIREDVDATVVSADDYDGRNGDLADLIESASNNGEIVDLGSGTYEMHSSIDSTGSMVAIAGDGATIYAVGDQSEYSSSIIFPLGGEDRILMQGFNVDISEGPDLALITTYGAIQEEGFFEDISFFGQRTRTQDGGFNNTVAIDSASGVETLIHRLEMPDGGLEGDGEKDEAIGISVEGHEGYNVWKDCYAEQWESNGFYLDAGENVVWNCHAKDNARGNIRISDGDVVVGGTAEVTSERDSQLAQPFVHQDGEASVTGLEIIVDGDSWGNAAVQLRSDQIHCEFEKLVVHIRGGSELPVRIDSTVNGEGSATFRDCYIYDEGSQDHTFHVPWANDGYCYLEEDVRVDSTMGDEFSIGSSGELHYEGEQYSSTTLSADDLGLESPLVDDGSLPSFYFDYGNDEGGTEGWLDLGSDDDYSQPTNEAGILFQAKENIERIEARLSENTDRHQTAYLRDSAAEVVTQTDISNLGAGDSFVLAPADGINADNTYSITVDADGGYWDRGEDSSPDYTYENESLAVTAGVYSGGQSTTQNVRYAVTEIRAGDGNLGTSISLPNPESRDSHSGFNGLYFNVQREVSGVRCTIADGENAPEGYTEAFCIDGWGEIVSPVVDVSDVDPGESFEIMLDEPTDTDFGVGLRNPDGNYYRSRYESSEYPYTGDAIDVDAGVFDTGPSLTDSVLYNFEDVVPILPE